MLWAAWQFGNFLLLEKTSVGELDSVVLHLEVISGTTEEGWTEILNT